MPASRARLASSVLFGALALAWGGNYLFVRWGLGYAAPLWLAAFRALLGAGGVALWLSFARPHGALDRAGRRDAALIGVPTTALFYGLWFLAAGGVPPGEAAVVVYTYPLWVTLVTAMWGGTRIVGLEVLAVAGGFAGVALVAEPWQSSGPLPIVPIVELLLAAIAWAVGTLAFELRFRGPPVMEANLYQLLGGGAVLLVAALATEPAGLARAAVPLVPILLWLGLIGTAFGYTVWYLLLDRFGAVTAASYVFAVPLVALAASALLFGERVEGAQLAGVALVCLAVFATARARRPGASPASVPGANRTVPPAPPE